MERICGRRAWTCAPEGNTGDAARYLRACLARPRRPPAPNDPWTAQGSRYIYLLSTCSDACSYVLDIQISAGLLRSRHLGEGFARFSKVCAATCAFSEHDLVLRVLL